MYIICSSIEGISSVLQQPVNAYGMLPTNDNESDINIDAFLEIGSNVTKSTVGTIFTSPVTEEESIQYKDQVFTDPALLVTQVITSKN